MARPEQPHDDARNPSMETVPRWNSVRRELHFRGRLVKRFRQLAVNQTIILDVFEQDGWPARIDDPLPQDDGIDPKQRLHDTIKALNRNQRTRLLRFHGDGTGEGVLWSPFHDRGGRKSE